jgi:hypothetical protein
MTNSKNSLIKEVLMNIKGIFFSIVMMGAISIPSDATAFISQVDMNKMVAGLFAGTAGLTAGFILGAQKGYALGAKAALGAPASAAIGGIVGAVVGGMAGLATGELAVDTAAVIKKWREKRERLQQEEEKKRAQNPA